MEIVKPKIFIFKDIIKHKFIKHLNLFEIVSQFPNKGLEFKVYLDYWKNKNKYFKLINVESRGLRYGVLIGNLYENNLRVRNKKPFIINDYTSRGLWRFEIDNFNVKLDNGMEYNQSDIIDYYNKLKNRHNQRIITSEMNIVEFN